MKKLLVFAGLLALFLFYNNFSYLYAAEEGLNEELVGLSRNYMDVIQQKDFFGAAKLFHYPPNYSSEELIKDQKGVQQVLELLNSEFGNVNEYKLVKTPEFYYSFLFMGGDILYWKSKPDYLSLLYEVEFSKEKRGFITISFCKINSMSQIRSVSYGLPSSRSDSMERIFEIGKKIYELD